MTAGKGANGEGPTLQDIARLAGVSTASVSRALNGRPGVSAETRAAIAKIAAAHRFTGNATARALSLGRHGRVGLMLPQVQAEYFARILSGAAEVFQQQGVSMALTTTEHDHERELRIVASMSHSAIDGGLMLLPHESLSELAALHASGFPFVIVDAEENIDLPLPWITCTHVVGARSAAEHLLSLGHRRIGVIGWERRVLANVDRLHGIRQAFTAAGLTFDETLLRHGHRAEIEDGYLAAGELLDLPEPPTAIFGLNDNLALGVLRAAAHRGVHVPTELSVVGFDDLQTAALVTPMLTTVRQPLGAMGAYGARVLLRWIEGDAPPAMHIQLPTELIVRESTMPPPDRPAVRRRGGVASAGA